MRIVGNMVVGHDEDTGGELVVDDEVDVVPFPRDALPQTAWAGLAETETYGREDVALVEEWARELQDRLPIFAGEKKIPGSVRGREFADALMRILTDYKRLKAAERPPLSPESADTLWGHGS